MKLPRRTVRGCGISTYPATKPTASIGGEFVGQIRRASIKAGCAKPGVWRSPPISIICRCHQIFANAQVSNVTQHRRHNPFITGYGVSSTYSFPAAEAQVKPSSQLFGAPCKSCRWHRRSRMIAIEIVHNAHPVAQWQHLLLQSCGTAQTNASTGYRCKSRSNAKHQRTLQPFISAPKCSAPPQALCGDRPDLLDDFHCQA